MNEVVEQKARFVSSYKGLDVYKRAYAVALDIHKISKNFPKEELYGLTAQARRASKSICANLAEGFGKQSKSSAEFMQFVSIALGSVNEMAVWISFMYDLGYIEQTKYDGWQEEYDAVSRMLNKLINWEKI